MSGRRVALMRYHNKTILRWIPAVDRSNSTLIGVEPNITPVKRIFSLLRNPYGHIGLELKTRCETTTWA